nr:unnamed protein product [Digitaria exilis]
MAISAEAKMKALDESLRREEALKRKNPPMGASSSAPPRYKVIYRGPPRPTFRAPQSQPPQQSWALNLNPKVTVIQQRQAISSHVTTVGKLDILLGIVAFPSSCIPTHPVYAHRSFQENMRAGGLCLCNLARNTLSSGEPAIAPGLGLPPSLEEPYEAEAPRGSALQREGRLASRALEMRPFGEAKCLEDGPDAAERRPRSGFPRAGGQETAISRHITTYRQHRRDPGR